MRQPRARERREVDIVAREQRVVTLHLVDLDQLALRAGHHLERKVQLGARQVLGAQEGVRRRRGAEVDEDVALVVERRPAMPALHARTPSNPPSNAAKAEVARREARRRLGPVDRQARVVVAHAVLQPGAVGGAVLVEQLAVVGEGLEAVGAAGRDQDLALVVGARAAPHASGRRWASLRAGRRRRRTPGRAGSGSASTRRRAGAGSAGRGSCRAGA